MLHHRSAAGQILINNKGYCYLDIKRYNLVVYDDFDQIVGVFPKHKGDRPNGGLNDVFANININTNVWIVWSKKVICYVWYCAY